MIPEAQFFDAFRCEKIFALSSFIHTCYAFCASFAQASLNVIVRMKTS